MKKKLISKDLNITINGIVIPNKNKLKTKVDEKGRVCTKCGVYKTWNNFKDTKGRGLLEKSASCSQCNNIKANIRHTENRKDTEYLKVERKKAKKYRTKLKDTDPCLTKSRNLRSRMLSRVRDLKVSEDEKLRLKLETPSALEYYEWLKTLVVDNLYFICAYSKEKIRIDGSHIEHKVPLTRGGSNKIDNLCISSRYMNTSKGPMTDDEFFQLLKLVSNWEDKGKNTILSRLNFGWYSKKR